MAQHYTRSTVSASAWCAPCGRHTQHRVDDRRISACLECIDRRQMETEQYEERAGIIEYLAHYDRATAEQMARNQQTPITPQQEQVGLWS